MATAEPLARLCAVSRRFDGPDGPGTVAVLQEVDLTIAPGEAVAITGPSGSGKSTLLQLLGTLDRPTAGEVRFREENVGSLEEDATALLRSQEIGFVFQAHYLLPQCTVLENVLIPTVARRRNGAPPPAELPAERARRLLDRVGLAHRVRHLPGELSGGERQRTAVVRALINGPSLLLADEPTGALDETSAFRLGELLAELNREEGVALVVATHSPELAARMTRRFRLHGGRLEPQI
jgi:ABC-type lipoprotein export system ATPase subunit